jgi:hypothetical protein
VIGGQPRHLWSVPPASGSEEDPEPPDKDEPESPEEDTRVLLW